MAQVLQPGTSTLTNPLDVTSELDLTTSWQVTKYEMLSHVPSVSYDIVKCSFSALHCNMTVWLKFSISLMVMISSAGGSGSSVMRIKLAMHVSACYDEYWANSSIFLVSAQLQVGDPLMAMLSNPNQWRI